MADVSFVCLDATSFVPGTNNRLRERLGGYSGTPPYYRGAVTAARTRNMTIEWAYGPVAPNTTTTNDTWTAAALAAAQKADVVLYFGGIDMTQESEDSDRNEIGWPKAQLDLMSKLSALGKPMVVAQLGGQLDDTPLLANKNISGVLWAGYPGQDGGTAVLDIITGKAAPAGRLPVTQYPASYVHEVPLTDMNLRPGKGNPGR
jgi:xylan 1,4-beta-xylosidase